MKALTLHQPWASLVACRQKRVETRSWYTPYRGPLAIHAGKALTPEGRELWGERRLSGALRTLGYTALEELPLGAVVATCELVRVVPMDPHERPPETFRQWQDRVAFLDGLPELELELGYYAPERWAWVLDKVEALEPVPVRGAQGLWDWLPLLDRAGAQ